MTWAHKGVALLLLAAGLVVLPACGGQQPSGPQKVSVVTTFYPLEYLAQRIGGDRVKVTSLVPPGTEPHDFEPSPKDVASIQKAALFVYNGAGLEPWADRIVQSLKGERPLVVNASQGVELLTLSEEAGQAGQAVDPHVWLDPQRYFLQAQAIHLALAQADSQGVYVYDANFEYLRSDLASLDSEMRQGLASCMRRTIVTSHAAFGYLAGSYNLRQISLAGFTPETEPSPARMKEIIQEVKASGATAVFYETLASPAVAETIARETGTQAMVLDPLEGLTPNQVQAGEDYFTIMHKNLANLRTALACQ